MKHPLRKAFRTIIKVLDRTPSGARGQSLLELSITTPIFFVMLLGLVEIGWAANNYLTLVDVSREAGRYGSVRDPITRWVDNLEYNYHYMDCDSYDDRFNTTGEEQLSTYPGPSIPGHSIGDDDQILYFDGVACAVIVNLPPVEFKDDVDDIVVSVISYAVVTSGGTRRANIVGRYPVRSNECADDVRDPFHPPWMTLFQAQQSTGWDNGPDLQRGYVFRGNHITEDGCRGSEFNISELEDMLNRTLLDDSGSVITADEVKEIPNNAVVLVEIFWEHQQLLNLPFFTWIGNPIPMNVWTFFPVTAAEPTATP